MTPGTGRGAGLQNPTSSMAGTTGSVWDELGVGRTHYSLRGRRSCSLDLSHQPQRLEQRGGRQHPPGSPGSGRCPRLGCRQVGGRRQHPGPWALSTPFSVPHPGSGFPAPRLSSVLSSGKGAPKLQVKTDQ